MAVTNLFANATTWIDILVIPNTQTGGYFWLGMLVLVFAVLLITLLSFGFEVAMLTAAFITFVIGLFFVYLGLVGWQWLMMFFGIILFIILYITWNSKSE